MDWSDVGFWTVVLVGVRSVARIVVGTIRAIDDLDGQRNWKWVNTAASVLDKVDAVLDVLPVKAPLVSSKRAR